MPKVYIITLLSLLLTPFLSGAQDTLHVGSVFETGLLNVNDVNTYIHYRVLKDGSMTPVSIKKIKITGKENQYHISQTEFAGSKTKTLETTVHARTLITDTHVRTAGDKRESYRFTDKSITVIPNDEKADNKGFEIELVEPTFNFEIDFIFLQSIDWKKHDSVVLNFYHPGGSLPPAYYTFSKEKEEKLKLASGIEIDTWIIMTDYNGQPPARFWISKDKNEIIRQETDVMEMAGFRFVKRLL